MTCLDTSLVFLSCSPGTAGLQGLLATHRIPLLSLCVILIIAYEALQLEIFCRPGTAVLSGVSVDVVFGVVVVLAVIRLGIGEAVVDVNQHVGEEEDDAGGGQEKEDVGDVVHGGSVDERHLLGGGADEKEAGGVEALGVDQVRKGALTFTGLWDMR